MASVLSCLRGDVSRGSKPDGTIRGEHPTWCHWNCMACFTSRLWHCVTLSVMYLPGYDLRSQSSHTKFHAPWADCALRYLFPFTHHCVKPINWERVSEEMSWKLWFHLCPLLIWACWICWCYVTTACHWKELTVAGLAICMAKLTLDGVLSRPLCDLGLGSFCVFISFWVSCQNSDVHSAWL